MENRGEDPVAYNVPTPMAAAYRDCPIVVRAEDPAEIAQAVAGDSPERISCIQLLSVNEEDEP